MWMASPVSYQRKRALIVGINKYRRDPLRYCINDAEDLKKSLESIKFQVSLTLDCGLSKFYRTIDAFADTIQRDDLVLFYFAGHGKQVGDENYCLPSDYDFDYRGTEEQYAPNNAVNMKYVMKKIDDRRCLVTIYIFDCCRTLVKTRGNDGTQGLLPMGAPSHTLIVYTCSPGKAVQDETRNGRNSSFIENFLKEVESHGKDIEDMMRDVATQVNQQTEGFQLPWRTSSLTSKVYLVADQHQGLYVSLQQFIQLLLTRVDLNTIVD